MGISSFKFVSPGVFVNEVDNSQLPRLGNQMGPVIIGRAERGPAMVPVRVESFADFVETFGAPVAGGQGDDVWRQGNKLGPTYGAYAAQAYLKNGSPITFVRLLGDQSPDADPSQGAAGWEVNSAFGLFVGEGSADTLAAVLYAKSDAAAPFKLDDPAVSNGKVQIVFAKPGTTTAGKNANGKLLLDGAGGDPVAAGHEIVVEKAVYGGVSGDYENLTIAFSAVQLQAGNPLVDVDSTFAWDGAKWVLTVGVNGLDLATEFAAVVERIRNAINSAAPADKGGAEQWNIRITAATSNSCVDRILTITRDQIGATTDFLDVTGAVSFQVLEETQGTDSQVAQTTTFLKSVNFDRSDKSAFIREVLNTNPTLTNSRITSTEALEQYYLGATFEQHLAAQGIDSITHAEIKMIDEYKSYRKPSTPPATPWMLSQYTGSKENMGTAITKSDLSQLFRFHSLYSGEWEQKNFKISIADIKGPTSEFLKYGTFSVLVREASDSDASPVIYERFTNVNLDPTSPRFIANAIGDTQMIWNDSQKRYVQVGEYPNQSRFIRVQVAEDIITGAMNPELLPFGFAVPGHNPELATHAYDDVDGDYETQPIQLADSNMPKFYLREDTVNDARLSSSRAAFFGISTDRPGNMGRFDESYTDIVRPLYGTEDMFAVDAGLFTLDWVGIDPNNPAHAVLASSGLFSGQSLNANDTHLKVLDSGYDKFTVPLCGGTDGLDVHEIEPFCDNILVGKSSVDSSPYYSVTKAIDSVSDPEVVECDVMVMPGISNPGLTGKLISVCEQRADALAIIDLEGDYVPRGWENTDEESRLPSVEDAISSLKTRGINSSYACAFFPWVQVRDDINNRLLWMPPSVPALGTLASSAANSELWFAPAGFTRGGLSQGAGGVPVTQTRLRLSSKERDLLYESSINPIAQFPSEGIVVFGQKTLQVTPSALDRINVRRLMIYVKKEISRMAATVLFDQNLSVTWSRFTSVAEPFLQSIQSRFGLTEYKVVLDETTTTPELVDRNIVYAKIFLKPARAIEYIAIDFVITNTGASFDD